MISVSKIQPKLYEYLRATSKASLVQTKPINTAGVQLKNLKLDCDRFEKLKYSNTEIEKAYKEYQNSPYINYYLRKSEPLSIKSNQIVSCLKQGINQSEPISGKFFRGIQDCKDDQNIVEKLVFNNKGFTSTAPEINKRYAESFYQPQNGVLIEFDLKTPTKGFKPNDYEVIFDTKAFSSDKYNLVKIKDRHYKVLEKTPSRPATKFMHFDEGGTIVFGDFPKDYVQTRIEKFEPQPTIFKINKIKGKGKTKTNTVQNNEIKELLPHYHIDLLRSNGAKTGTNAVQSVVEESLKNPLTKGRVTLDAQDIDKVGSPAGFYYKLGFRFSNPSINEEFATWLKNGGTRANAPQTTGFMFLPKENIEHCLNYGK